MKAFLHINAEIRDTEVKKGIYLVLLHATRVPPHIGLLVDNVYHSLSIKGQELNISGDVLLKNISVRKIPAVFVKIKKQPVFSNEHLQEIFSEQVKMFERVGVKGSTCLSPVKLFFDEFYAINREKVTLIFDLLGELAQESYIEASYGAHLGELQENIFHLTPYTKEDLDKEISGEAMKLQK